MKTCATNPVIQRLGLEASAVTRRAGGVGAVAAEQHAHVHFVGLALEPFEEALHAVPAVALFILLVLAVLFLAIDDEILIRFRQLLEWLVHVDLFARAGAEQILLRFAHLFAAENAHRAFGNGKRAIRNRALQIDRDGAAEAAAFRASAERAIKAEQTRRGRANIEIAVRAMPAGGERMFLLRFEIDEIDPVFAEAERGLDRFDHARA